MRVCISNLYGWRKIIGFGEFGAQSDLVEQNGGFLNLFRTAGDGESGCRQHWLLRFYGSVDVRASQYLHIKSMSYANTRLAVAIG
jgi:hypothetical protein